MQMPLRTGQWTSELQPQFRLGSKEWSRMPVTYTNRKGKIYYLHQGATTKGNPKYFFAQRDEGDLVETIPPGFEIYENPNAQVFLRRKRAQIITDEEVETVKAGVQQHSKLEYFIVDVKGNAIIVYTPDQDIDLLLDTFDLLPVSYTHLTLPTTPYV
jgi:hypothetical protein